MWEKTLGVFTERRTEAGLVRVENGATLTLAERTIHVCVAGTGSIGDEPVRKYTVIHVGAGESVRLVADEECTLLRMVLPDLTGLETGIDEAHRVAAE